MTNHDNFFSQYFLSVLDPLLGSPARYKKISRPPFTRGSRGYAAAQPMFNLPNQKQRKLLLKKITLKHSIKRIINFFRSFPNSNFLISNRSLLCPFFWSITSMSTIEFVTVCGITALFAILLERDIKIS